MIGYNSTSDDKSRRYNEGLSDGEENYIEDFAEENFVEDDGGSSWSWGKGADSFDTGQQRETSADSGKHDIWRGIVLVVVCLIVGLKGCSFIGEKVGSVANFFSGNYQFESFSYDNTMYVGNRRWNKPDGVCATIPLHSDGKNYTVGVYDGTKIEGYGIICSSDIPLQASSLAGAETPDYDAAKLKIRMGEMKESILNGYGAVFDSEAGTVVLGRYKDGKLKKYGCRVTFDENGNIASVEAVKKDKVKKTMKDGSYRGMRYYEDEGKIVIDDFEFVIDGGEILLKTDGVEMSVKGRQWRFDLYKEKTEEGIYIEYDLGVNLKCKVLTNDSKGIRVSESELPIGYGTKETTENSQ